jgi:molybdopterin/thiamine biosynthesis adenylyltransferase
MASGEVDALDEASLDQFRIDLIKAGFEPASPGSRRWWRGPIAEPLKLLTSSDWMEIVMQDGWPFRAPRLLIPNRDIVSDHVNAEGEICLWRPDDASGQWMTWAGFQDRIAQWCARQADGFDPQDALLDAHLYFTGASAGLATVDLTSLRIDQRDPAGATNKIFAQWNKNKTVLYLSSTRPPNGKTLEGRCYFHARPLPAPPRDLPAFRDALTSGQQTNFTRRLKNVQQSGDAHVAALLWATEHGVNGLVLLLTRNGDSDVQAQSLELAPSGTDTLRLRCGPDAELLQAKHVTIFGAGAIGSHVALALAEAGLGKLRLFDADRLRPGNTVRHASVFSVGDNKANATAIRIAISAPWTKSRAIEENPWGPARIRELIHDTDLVVDATGSARFTGLISRITEHDQRPVISAALYRGGAIARVRRQAPGRDVTLHARTDAARYPLIPPGDEPLALEAGCGAPVNSASPIAVTAIAALTSEIAIDAVAERFGYSEETIDVYRALDSAPYDRIGRVTAGA